MKPQYVKAVLLLAGLAALPTPVRSAPDDRPAGHGPVTRGAGLLVLDEAIRREFRGRYPGVLPDLTDRPPGPGVGAFDWSDVVRGGMNVHNQASYRTCWAHAPVAALEWNWKIRNGTAHVLSVQPILDRTGKTGGGRVDLVFDELLRHGTARATDYPYTGQPGGFRADVPTRYRPIAWGHVGGRGEVPPVEGLKQAILDHGPVAASVWTDRAFHGYRGGVFAGSGAVRPGASNHAVLITGWDDARGAWRVQNSWGVKWGERGHMWIRYGANNIGLNAVWVVAQSRFYPLPDGAHTRLGPGADPFPSWRSRYPMGGDRVAGRRGDGPGPLTDESLRTGPGPRDRR
jgi:Papain family cysteine protease